MQDSGKPGEGLNQSSAWKGQARSRYRKPAGLSRWRRTGDVTSEREAQLLAQIINTPHSPFCPAVSCCAFHGLNPTRTHRAREHEAVRNGRPPRVGGKWVQTDRVVEEQMEYPSA